jgi:hypothetical protein
MLTALEQLPRDAEVLAMEAGCDQYCEIELDGVELQGEPGLSTSARDPATPLRPSMTKSPPPQLTCQGRFV